MIDRRNTLSHTHTNTHTPIAVLYNVCCFIETILFRRTLRCSCTTIRATVIAINKRFYRIYNYMAASSKSQRPVQLVKAHNITTIII